MYKSVRAGNIDFRIDLDMADEMQDEIDKFLVTANLIGYNSEQSEVTRFIFLTVSNVKGPIITIRLSLDKQRVVFSADVFTFQDRIQMMKEKHRVKMGEMTFTKNFLKAVKIANGLL